MQAKDDSLIKFLNQNNVCFEIPVYQRNYDWNLEQCKQLIDDISFCIKNNRESYFLGSIVHIQDKRPFTITGINKVVIIDGQQRITTISLLLLAIANTIDSESKKNHIINSYLVNHMQDGLEKIKLKPIKNDNIIFSEILNGNSITNYSSSILRNYKYFLELLKTKDYLPEEILEGIGRLRIVEIMLEIGKDNPQLIFESLNSTGLGLKSSDLVRNFILMSEEPELQTKLYEKYWIEIEQNCNFQTEDFIRCYLMIKDKNVVKKDLIYKTFKDYVFKLNDKKAEDVLKELQFYSRLYSQVWNDKNKHMINSDRISNALRNLQSLQVFPTVSYLMSLMEDYNNNILNEETVLKAIEICESYIIRRSICDIPSSSLIKTFSSMHREVKRTGDDWQNKYINYLMFNYNRRGNKGRFPSDAEVNSLFHERDFYHLQPEIRNFILNSLENKNKREQTKLIEDINEKKLSIEHIMPQTLNKEWKITLGENYKNIHEKYLNVIGNLTVTGYNSIMSNKSFEDKKSDSFDESPFWLNKYLKKVNTWGEKEIKERTVLISERAMEIWPDVDRTINFESNNYEIHSLDEEYEIEYTKPVTIEIDGNLFKAQSYREVTIAFLKYLLNLDSNKLFELQKIDNFKGVLVNEDVSKFKSALKFEEGLYTEGWYSANDHVKRIKRTANYFNIKLEDIIITTYKEKKKSFKKHKAA